MRRREPLIEKSGEKSGTTKRGTTKRGTTDVVSLLVVSYEYMSTPFKNSRATAGHSILLPAVYGCQNYSSIAQSFGGEVISSSLWYSWASLARRASVSATVLVA